MTFRPRDFFHGVAAEREREAVGFRGPPLAEIGAEDEALAAVGELAFVDDEAGVGFAAREGVEDLIEGDDDVVELFLGHAEEELELEERAGHEAGNGDLFGEEFLARELALADDHGAVAVAHAGAVGEERVVLEDVGVGVDGDRGDVELGAGGALVEGSGCPGGCARIGSPWPG